MSFNPLMIVSHFSLYVLFSLVIAFIIIVQARLNMTSHGLGKTFEFCHGLLYLKENLVFS